MSDIVENTAIAAPSASGNSRIAARYDQAPYDSHCYPQSHPARLAAIASLFGLSPPQVANARVLEIGCASGGNIIPLAAQFPNAKFTGLELSPVQAQAGASMIERLGLANIQILAGDVAYFSAKGAKFDFILCHGVYSWAPQSVRDAILQLIGKRLAPDGVAFVSYNVLPGWRPKQVLRDALMSRVKDLADVGAQIAFTRAFLDRLKQWPGGQSSYHRDLKDIAAHAEGLRDDYVAHEFLEIDNEPQTFMQFVEEADRAGLTFLGESELWMQIAENFDAPTRELLRDLSDNRLLAMEQSIDILTGRTFRQTLLVNRSQGEKIIRLLAPERLKGLHIMGPVRLLEEDNSAPGWTFQGVGQKRLTTSSPAAKRAFDALAQRGASSLSFETMLAAGGGDEAERALVADAIYKAVVAGIVNIWSTPVEVANGVAAMPIAPSWARAEVEAGQSHIANARHESATLNIVGRILFPLLDGAHDAPALEAALAASVVRDEVQFLRDGARVVDADGVAACVREHVARTLDQFAAAALLQSA